MQSALNIGTLAGGVGEFSMVYKEKFVAVVKCNGRVLREICGAVLLPFGSEYSLMLKNMESRKALVKISIDGKPIGSNSLILEPNREIELERWVDSPHKFKFIKKTDEIVENRGDRIDDGTIRIEYQFEQYKTEATHNYMVYHDVYYHNPWRIYPSYPYWGEVWCCNSAGKGVGSCPTATTMSCNATPTISSNIAADEGITARGSESGQQFQQGYIGSLDNNSHVIILCLKGTDEKNVVLDKPITVKEKKRCSICNKTTEYTDSFCPCCGSAL